MLLLCAVAETAGAQTPATLQVEVGGVTRPITETELKAMPQDTVRGRAHGGPEEVFVGPTLARVLAAAGAPVDSLRGRALAQYVVVEARDGYRVVFAVAELSAALSPQRVILAHTVDGRPLAAEQAPFRVIAEGELRPARWARQVTALRLKAAPE